MGVFLTFIAWFAVHAGADSIVNTEPATRSTPARPVAISSCAQDAALREDLLKLAQKDWTKDIPSAPGLVYFGDPHIAHDWVERRYQEAIRKIGASTPGKKCLFLEQDADPLQAHLDACNRMSSRGSHNFLGQQRSSSGFFPLNCPGRKPTYIANGPTIEAALRNGWSVFAVDALQTKCAGSDGALEKVRCRNIHMAEKIKGAFKAGCKAGIVINGNAHLDTDLLKDSATQKLMEKAGVPTSAVVHVVNRSSVPLNESCGADMEFLNSYAGAITGKNLAGAHPVQRGRLFFGGSTHTLIGTGKK